MNNSTYTLSHLPGKENEVSDGMSRKVDEMTDDEFDAFLSRLHVHNLTAPSPSDDEANIYRSDPSGLDLLKEAEINMNMPADFHSANIAASVKFDRRRQSPEVVQIDATVAAKFNHIISKSAQFATTSATAAKVNEVNDMNERE
jgi:hypothetical protein